MREPWSGFQSRWPNPVVCGRKFCPKCGKWRLVATEFDMNGKTNRLRTWCRTCTLRENRAYARKRTEEQRERRREYHRIWTEARRRAAGVPPRRFNYSSENPKRRATAIDKAERILLPVEPILGPLLDYLDDGGDVLTLVEASGVSEKGIHRLLSGESARVRLDNADKLAVALGLHLDLLYDYEEAA